jgi:hypothetical protein
VSLFFIYRIPLVVTGVWFHWDCCWGRTVNIQDAYSSVHFSFKIQLSLKICYFSKKPKSFTLWLNHVNFYLVLGIPFFFHIIKGRETLQISQWFNYNWQHRADINWVVYCMCGNLQFLFSKCLLIFSYLLLFDCTWLKPHVINLQTKQAFILYPHHFMFIKRCSGRNLTQYFTQDCHFKQIRFQKCNNATCNKALEYVLILLFHYKQGKRK